jgi:hypothetical protein
MLCFSNPKALTLWNAGIKDESWWVQHYFYWNKFSCGMSIYPWACSLAKCKTLIYSTFKFDLLACQEFSYYSFKIRYLPNNGSIYLKFSI